MVIRVARRGGAARVAQTDDVHLGYSAAVRSLIDAVIALPSGCFPAATGSRSICRW